MTKPPNKATCKHCQRLIAISFGKFITHGPSLKTGAEVCEGSRMPARKD